MASKALYNGIALPDEWPPRRSAEEMRAGEPMARPYLESPPAVISIDVGRQLFVDDFLVEQTTLSRCFYKAQPYEGNPVLRPEKRWETMLGPARTMAFSGGVFYDPQDKLFKMWYMAGNHGCTAYATSEDGVAWTKPSLGARPGTNVVLLSGRGDSSTAWLDLESEDPRHRFKFFQYHFDTRLPCIHTSPDGVHWTDPIWCGFSRDRSTMFYNPFRKVWVFSLRDYLMTDVTPGKPGMTRTRRYRETKDFFDVHWKGYAQPSDDALPGEPALWTACDRLDWEKTGPETRRDSFYNVDAVGYESLMLGLFSVLHHPKPGERPKFNDVQLGFSRDGFHWDRPFREAIVTIHDPMDPDAWNLGNVQSVGGGCLVVGDRLFFYYSGRNGVQGTGECFTGLAFMRRDGFASMDAGEAEGALTTRLVKFAGKRLFVNVNCPRGELRAEVLDQDGRVIAPFTRGNCIPVAADRTLQQVVWKEVVNLSALSGKPVRFRFYLKNGSLYSFWVSPDESGASYGYAAAGGPGFTGPRDTVGTAAYGA